MRNFDQDSLLAYNDAVAALEAVSDLVTTAMGAGEELSRISYGVSVIFDQQVAVLNRARALVADAVKPKSALGEAGLRRIEPMGTNMVMVTEPDGRRYMTTPELAGVNPAGTKRVRFNESPMDIRKRVIADLVSDGKVAGEIAQAMGIKKDTVEKVMGQLLSRQVAEPAAAPAKAVNE